MPEVTYNRVNWKDSPDADTPINATNLNKMDKGIADCVAKVNECFQSASEGKTLIASALTGKGQSSTSADTYAQMAAKINNLMAVPTATKSITSNGSNIDVTNFGKVNVSVQTYKWIAPTDMEIIWTSQLGALGCLYWYAGQSFANGSPNPYIFFTNNQSQSSRPATLFFNAGAYWDNPWICTTSRACYVNGTYYPAGSSVSIQSNAITIVRAA